jgi:hypothetical protein
VAREVDELVTLALSPGQIGDALTQLDNYRVKRVQQVLGPHLGILALALGLRETGLKNIEGGAVLKGGEWVFAPLDVGAFQISRKAYPWALGRMPAVKAGSWAPIEHGHTPMDIGYVPRYEEQVQFLKPEFHETRAWCMDHKIRGAERDQFTASAHNAGLGGAIEGWKRGDVDLNTAHGNYGRFVVAQMPTISRWLEDHARWKGT